MLIIKDALNISKQFDLIAIMGYIELCMNYTLCIYAQWLFEQPRTTTMPHHKQTNNFSCHLFEDLPNNINLKIIGYIWKGTMLSLW